ncbi:MAG TPA: hypothetical protein VFE62_25540 [Gemmataceae bacterium]|nr:hypothetical protein [Gemmataceae bacterium]
MLTMELPDWDYQMVWGAKLATDEVMGVAGGVYRARCGREAATFERIAEPDLPKGVIVPAWNSGTIPLRGMMRFANSTKRGGFIGTEFKAAKITGKEPKDAKAELELDYRPDGFPQKASVTVKAGDYVLIDEKGHLIRAIAPPNKETRVVGWIEIASERVPEANLVRDKKSIVRPRFEGDKK